MSVSQSPITETPNELTNCTNHCHNVIDSKVFSYVAMGSADPETFLQLLRQVSVSCICSFIVIFASYAQVDAQIFTGWRQYPGLADESVLQVLLCLKA